MKHIRLPPTLAAVQRTKTVTFTHEEAQMIAIVLRSAADEATEVAELLRAQAVTTHKAHQAAGAFRALAHRLMVA